MVYYDMVQTSFWNWVKSELLGSALSWSGFFWNEYCVRACRYDALPYVSEVNSEGAMAAAIDIGSICVDIWTEDLSAHMLRYVPDMKTGLFNNPHFLMHHTS